MREQRRHQRIRFAAPPPVRVGQYGGNGSGELENLSLGGLMLRSAMPLRVGEPIGCEFTIYASPRIDLSAQVVSRVGDLYTARFQPGPASELLIQSAIDLALGSGQASILSLKEVGGRKVMRVVGGLNGSLRNDFMYNLSKIGIAELDLAAVTGIDAEGAELCRIATGQYQVELVDPADCVKALLGL